MDSPFKPVWQRDMEHRMKDSAIDCMSPRASPWIPTQTKQGDKSSSYFDDVDFGLNMSSYPRPISTHRRSIKPPSRPRSPMAMSQPQSLSSGVSSSIDSALATPRDGMSVSSRGLGDTKRARSSRARHGPLTPTQRYHAAFIRRIGACDSCRERKVKCNPSHRMPISDESQYVVRTSGISSSFPSLVLAVTILRRCLKHTFQRKNSWQEDLLGMSILSSRELCAWPRAGTPVGLGVHSWELSQTSNTSPETNSVDSFEDELSEDGVDDFLLYHDEPAEQTETARLEELLAAVHSLLKRLPDDVAFSLAVEIQTLYHKFFSRGTYYSRTPYPHTPSSSNSHNPLAGTPINSSSSGSGQKRPSDNGADWSSPSGNGNGDSNRKRPKKSPSSPGRGGKRWACPYYLREPHKYCVESEFGDYRKCARSPGFGEVHRVKEHLLRCHSAIYCPQCHFQFKKEEELDTHYEEPWRCNPLLEKPALEGLNRFQKRQLKPRDRRPEEERWEALYKICFPHDQVIPSGEYVHYSHDYAVLRHDVLAVLEDETRIPDSIDILRLMQRVREAFDMNASNTIPRLHPTWRSSLPPTFPIGDDSQPVPLVAPLHDPSSPWSPEDLQSDPVRGNAEIPILISRPNEETGPSSDDPDPARSPYMGYQAMLDFGEGEGAPQLDLNFAGFGS